MATHPASARRARERDLVQATRALFDDRGVQDAPIEEIAKAVGIARGLIYRQFSSKEELFVLTVTDYLDELAGVLREAIGTGGTPEERLDRCGEAYASYCRRFPAFLDCCLSLMRGPGRELQEKVSESVFFRLGQAMVGCIEQLAAVLREGNAADAWDVEDPDYVANLLWTQTLGMMHLARVEVGVRQAAPGVPALFRVDPDDVVRRCVESALCTVRGPARP